MFRKLTLIFAILLLAGAENKIWASSSEELSPVNTSQNTRKRSLQDESSLRFDSESDSPDKKKRRTSMYLREEHSQVYAIPTYDATFKYLMADEEICASFLKSFIPDENITDINYYPAQAGSLVNACKAD